MIHYLHILAQAVPPVNTETLLFAYGPMGVMLAWFMWRFETLLQEFRKLRHQIEGGMRATLVDVLSRPSSGPVAREYAQKMLAEIEAKDNRNA